MLLQLSQGIQDFRRGESESLLHTYELQSTNHGTLHQLCESPQNNQTQQLNQHNKLVNQRVHNCIKLNPTSPNRGELIPTSTKEKNTPHMSEIFELLIS